MTALWLLPRGLMVVVCSPCLGGLCPWPCLWPCQDEETVVIGLTALGGNSGGGSERRLYGCGAGLLLLVYVTVDLASLFDCEDVIVELCCGPAFGVPRQTLLWHLNTKLYVTIDLNFEAPEYKFKWISLLSRSYVVSRKNATLLSSVRSSLEPSILTSFSHHVNSAFSQLQFIRFLRLVWIQSNIRSWKIRSMDRICRKARRRLRKN